MNNISELRTSLLSNFCNLITVRLDDSNYVTWKFLLETLLRGCGLMKYIEGSFPCPPRHMVREEDGVTSDMTEEYMNWVQTDSAVMSLLSATLSSAALSCVVGSKNSWEVWKTLRERYGVSRSTAMQLKTNLYTIQKGTDTINKYFERIKGITDQLATVGINIPNEEIIFIAANGLPSEYKVIKVMIKAQITSMSMNELRSFLLDEESIMDQPAKPIQVPHIATMVSGSDPCHNSTYTSSSGYVVNSLPATTYMVNTAENNGVTTHVGYIHPLSQYSGYTQQNVNTCFSQPTGFMAQNNGGIQLHYGCSQQQQHGIYPQNNGSSKFNDGFTSQTNSGYSLHNTRHPQGNYSQNNARSFNKSNSNQNGRDNPRLRYNTNENQNFGGSIVCQICEKPGHGAYRCYYRTNDALQYQICKKYGHTTKNCRQSCQSMELWRSLPLFPPG